MNVNTVKCSRWNCPNTFPTGQKKNGKLKKYCSRYCANNRKKRK